jgi:hypothetical protein
LTALLLALVAWFASLCLFALPAHACCQQSVNYRQSSSASHPMMTVAACCESQTFIQKPASQATNGLDTTTIGAGHSFDFSAIFDPQADQTNLSRLALRHVPDQSGRYLELRVLLN